MYLLTHVWRFELLSWTALDNGRKGVETKNLNVKDKAVSRGPPFLLWPPVRADRRSIIWLKHEHTHTVTWLIWCGEKYKSDHFYGSFLNIFRKNQIAMSFKSLLLFSHQRKALFHHKMLYRNFHLINEQILWKFNLIKFFKKVSPKITYQKYGAWMAL